MISNIDICFTVMILCVRGSLVRKCMLAAHKLGMTKGEWAFLDVVLVQVKHCANIVIFLLLAEYSTYLFNKRRMH